MKVIITFTFCCGKLWKSKFLALEKPGKLGIFFSYFVATLINLGGEDNALYPVLSS